MSAAAAAAAVVSIPDDHGGWWRLRDCVESLTVCTESTSERLAGRPTAARLPMHCSMFIQLHVSQLRECITSRRFSLGGYACLRFVTNCIAVVIAPPPEYCDDRVCLSVCPRVGVYLFRNYTCNLRHFCSCYL